MNYRHRLKYVLAHTLHISHKQAQQLLEEGRVKLNGTITTTNELTDTYSHIESDGVLLSKAHLLRYVKYHKPRGVECSMNKDIANSLAQYLPEALHGLYHVGRLDKESEGLILLTNDGQLSDSLLKPENKITKVYVVETDKPIDDTFLNAMQLGVEIMGKMAKAEAITQLDAKRFEITLTQGLNRQIRRMCYKLGYEVTRLQRISFGDCSLQNLQAGDWKAIKKSEVITSP